MHDNISNDHAFNACMHACGCSNMMQAEDRKSFGVHAWPIYKRDS